MPNTIRTEAELLALFIDNNQGLINAQDMRDFVVSSRIGQTYPGPRGHQGSNGSPGSQGAQGRIGPQGAQGEGSTVQGPTGLQGYQGVQGAGFQGDVGGQGPQGYQGFAGVDGNQGSQGYQGFAGIDGTQGYQGAAGTGLQGYQGADGLQGYQGNQGAAGTGLQGYQGADGLQGYQGNQGFQGSDASVSYTNASATPSTIGGITSGSTFSLQTMQQMWDRLLYPYQSPAFSSFVMSGQSTSVEVGVTISGTKTFTWGTTNSGNVSPNTILIRDVTNNVDLATSSANDGTESIALPTAIQKTSQATHQWSIRGTNTNAVNFSATFTVSWFWQRYYGPSTNTTLTESQIEALTNSGLASGFSGTFAYAGGGYKFFCFPTSFGSPVSFKDAATNLNVAMASSVDDAFFSNTANSLSYGLVSVTNAFSQTTNYRVYRSKNILGGAISIIVA